ncbi:unnamed protein product [Rotaria sp. Silwood2]|nr:unnamed protein product [Rotaria sp. Silwood2]
MSLQQQIQNESEQFQALFDRLSDTQSSEAAQSEARSYLISCQNRALLIQEKIDTFNAAADKEHKRLVGIQGHGVKHIWYKLRGQLKQRLDEQEKKWLCEFEKCKEEEQRLAAVQEQINSTQNHLHRCKIAYEEYVKTKRALDELFERFFAGVTPSYPDEDTMEQNLKREKECLITLQNNHRNLTHIFHLLRKAHRAIIVTRRALNDALDMNTIDLFTNSGIVDIFVSSDLAKARNAATQAQQFINEASCLYPHMAYVGDLHIEQDNLIFNMLFDNIWTDLNMRKKIREASDRISRADTVLARILLAIRQKLDKCEADREQTSKNVKQLAEEHFSARIAIVRNIIEPPPRYSAV